MKQAILRSLTFTPLSLLCLPSLISILISLGGSEFVCSSKVSFSLHSREVYVLSLKWYLILLWLCLSLTIQVTYLATCLLVDLLYCKGPKLAMTLLPSPWGHVAMSADIFGCHNSWGCVRAADIYWEETRHATNHSTKLRMAPTARDYQAPSVNSAGAEKACSAVNCWQEN